MTGHLYLSYHHYDTEFTLQLAADLKNNGVQVWMDRLDVPVNADWHDSTRAAWQDANGILVILSPDYLVTPYCMAELSAIQNAGGAVYPVMIREVDVRRLPAELSAPLDFSDWRSETTYAPALGELLATIPADTKGETPSWETRYLTSLIAELEARRSAMTVIETPVDPQSAEASIRPQPLTAAFAWPMSFSVTMDREGDSIWDAREYVTRGQIRLNSIYDALKEYPRFVLLGEAGGGKTTALRSLALEAARNRLENPSEYPLPLLLYLPLWDAEPSFMDFAYQQWPGTVDLAGMLTSGEIMLFLDGLNEMGATGHRKTQKLREWMGSQPALRTIITCRTGDYTRELDLHLPTIVADVMTPSQVQAFARHYLGDNATSFLKQIMVEQYEERGLTWLAGTPYLLSALIAVFQSRGMLPRNAGTLFQALAQIVWEQPVLKQMPGWIPFAEMESAFAQLAHTMIHQDKPTDISLRRALLSLTGKSWWQKTGPGWMDLLWVAHHAHLIEIRGTQVRFYHRLIQEYFAAVKLRETGLKNVLVRPEFYLGRVAGKWDQVIIALCGLVNNVEDTVRYIMRQDPWLALDCIRSGIQVSPQAHEMLLNELLNQMLGIDWPVRRAAVRALGEIGDPAAIPGLVMNGLLDTDWPVRRAAATALGQIGVPDVVSGLIEALQDQNQIVRQAAVDALEAVGSAAVPALVEKLPDTHYPWRSEWRICDYAADALKRIATRDALDALDTWRQTAAT